jgi:hypothetical protein
MKTLTTLLVLLLSTPVAAQDGPIARAVKAQYARPDMTTTYTTEMRSPVLFWSGLAIVSAGVFITVAGITWEQDSDLSRENPNTRLWRDLAPCGTERTLLPVADCKPNASLLWLGSAMEVGGGIMMVVGGQTVQVTSVGPHSMAMAMRVKF